jgi:ATP-dependent exoDNAse (exonuclease V) alpha subunit
MIIPAGDTYTFMREANVVLEEPHEVYLRNPIVFFAHKILNRERLKYGNYDTVNVVSRRQMNLYNLRSCDMNLTVSEALRDEINLIYRERILKRKDSVNVVGERVICAETAYGQRITNPDNKKVKVYLTKGSVGTLTKVNKHVATTKYVPCEFKLEFYHEPFTELVLERHYLNKMVDVKSTQLIPDEINKFDYAYALTTTQARYSHWDKVTMIIDENDEEIPELQQRLLYSGITAARKGLTLVI